LNVFDKNGGKKMERIACTMGWEIVEEDLPDFKGRIFKDRPKNVVELLEYTVKKFPDREGFISADSRMTYREFDRIVNRIAAGLEKHGVRRGDHVAVLLGIQLEFPLTFFALMKLGAIVVPLNTRFKGEELAYEISDSESKLLIVDEEYWPFIKSVRDQLTTVERIFFNGTSVPEGTLPFSLLRENKEEVFTRAVLSEADAAAIMYTSGTTGKPKGAILHQRGFVLTAMLTADFMQYRPGDKMIGCVPLFHITGLAMVMLSPIFSGVACVYMKAFKTKDFLETVSREKVTHYTGVINIIWLMINHADFGKYDFSSFRIACFGGSPATEEMVKGIMSKMPHLRMSVGYGLTESFGMVSTTPYEDVLRKIKGAGKPLCLVDARIVDEEGHELPSGSVGEIMLKGAKIFKGYWKKPEATKETIVDGWVHTGDIGKIDDEGFLYILDRKKDMINRGGEKIYSLEVENVIFNYPKVLETAVVGVPDSVMGEVVKAVVVLKDGETATEEELKQFCTAHLADYKVPKFVEFLKGLPRNPAGKVIKAELRYVPGNSGGQKGL
jgi:long-chain acyl-CoA synthetase